MKGRPVLTGLLGGSFNPAHGGHRRITLFGARALGLDEAWWLVSPGNPLKSAAGMAPLAAAWGYLGAGEPVHAWGADAVLDAPAHLLQWLRLP